MSAHTKRHPTREPLCPTHVKEGQKSIPWRNAFKKGIEEFSEIGLVLKGGRSKAGLTQKQLAEKIGIKTHHISEMEHGKRPIGKKMAHRLAEVLNVDYRVFL
jgi:ribosome-binding protein aMBF1 (putative translation factor)